MTNPVERYLRSIGEIRRTGAAVPETSYYGCLETLLNEVGDALSPRVRAVLTLRDEGAGPSSSRSATPPTTSSATSASS